MVCGERSCWIGLSEPEDSEQWFWQDGSAPTFLRWYEPYGEPNNYNVDETVAIMNLVLPEFDTLVNGYWFDTIPQDNGYIYPMCERTSDPILFE